MKKLQLKALELSATKLLTREQMKKVLGGSGGGNNILCYCFSPILPNGQYGIQWTTNSCANADISGHCGDSGGECGAC